MNSLDLAAIQDRIRDLRAELQPLEALRDLYGGKKESPASEPVRAAESKTQAKDGKIPFRTRRSSVLGLYRNDPDSVYRVSDLADLLRVRGMVLAQNHLIQSVVQNLEADGILENVSPPEKKKKREYGLTDKGRHQLGFADLNPDPAPKPEAATAQPKVNQSHRHPQKRARGAAGETRGKVLKIVTDSPRLTTKDIGELLGMTTATAYSHLMKLRENGKVLMSENSEGHATWITAYPATPPAATGNGAAGQSATVGREMRLSGYGMEVGRKRTVRFD